MTQVITYTLKTIFSIDQSLESTDATEILINKQRELKNNLAKSTGNKFGFNLLLTTTKMKRPSLLEPSGSLLFPYEYFDCIFTYFFGVRILHQGSC